MKRKKKKKKKKKKQNTIHRSRETYFKTISLSLSPFLSLSLFGYPFSHVSLFFLRFPSNRDNLPGRRECHFNLVGLNYKAAASKRRITQLADNNPGPSESSSGRLIIRSFGWKNGCAWNYYIRPVSSAVWTAQLPLQFTGNGIFC